MHKLPMFPTIAEQFGHCCLHFSGIQNDRCRAGVLYADITDFSVRPYRRPCHTDKTAATSCTRRQMPSADEIAAHVAETEAWIARIEGAERRGECTACGALIERAEGIGRCIYARPCGCRIGQGDAATFNAQIAARRIGARVEVSGSRAGVTERPDSVTPDA